MKLLNDVVNGQTPEITFQDGRWTVSAWNALTTRVGATKQEAVESWNEFMETIMECEEREHAGESETGEE